MRLTPTTVLLAISCLAGSAAPAHARDFDALIRELRSRYAVQFQGVPGGWLARLALKMSRPGGILDVRIASLEGDGVARLTAAHDLPQTVRETLGAGWQPMVQVTSRRDGRWVSIHARCASGSYSLFIVTLEPADASVIEVRLEPDRLLDWIRDPLNAARRSPA